MSLQLRLIDLLQFLYLLLYNSPIFQKREIDLKQFAICQGYKTENQLAYFKKCNDHHKSWDSICNIYRQAMAMELMWPYVNSHSNPTADG